MTDWTSQAADVIENTVTAVRDKTVEPAQAIVRVVVFGLLAALLLIPTMVLFGVLLFRLAFLALEDHPWVPYGIASVLCVLFGSFCMAKRQPKSV